MRGRKLAATFGGGRLTSDGGVLLMAQAARRLGIAEKLAAVIPDRRDPSQMVHPLPEIVLARILAIACGYEDADYLDHLHADPAFKFACGHLRKTFVGYGVGIAGMTRLEGQVLDGSAVAAAEMRAVASAGDEANAAALDTLDGTVRSPQQRLLTLTDAREALAQALLAPSSPSDLAFLESATGLYETQMHEMYGLFGALDAAHRAAEGFAEQAHSV